MDIVWQDSRRFVGRGICIPHIKYGAYVEVCLQNAKSIIMGFISGMIKHEGEFQ